jgi:hypothetical protein
VVVLNLIIPATGLDGLCAVLPDAIRVWPLALSVSVISLVTAGSVNVIVLAASLAVITEYPRAEGLRNLKLFAIIYAVYEPDEVNFNMVFAPDVVTVTVPVYVLEHFVVAITR